MKRHTLLLAVAVAALLPSALRAQQYTGTSGLIHIPSAEMHHEGDALIGGHYLNQHMVPDTGTKSPSGAKTATPRSKYGPWRKASMSPPSP